MGVGSRSNKPPLSLVIGIFLDQAAVRSDHDHRRVHAVISQALNEFA